MSKFASLLLQETTDQANLCTGVGGISYHTTGSQYSGKDLGEETGQENCLPHIFFYNLLSLLFDTTKGHLPSSDISKVTWAFPHPSSINISPQTRPQDSLLEAVPSSLVTLFPVKLTKITGTELNKILEI